MLLHGGPGSAMWASARRYFDPQHYRIQFDQRGCGLSTLNAADSLERNAAADPIADMEALRQKLGVESWLVFGNSWESTQCLPPPQTLISSSWRPKEVRVGDANGSTVTADPPEPQPRVSAL